MFFGGGLMWIFWLLILAVLIAAIVAATRSRHSGDESGTEAPLDILKKRFARGEIDEEEFNRRRKELLK